MVSFGLDAVLLYLYIYLGRGRPNLRTCSVTYSGYSSVSCASSCSAGLVSACFLIPHYAKVFSLLNIRIVTLVLCDLHLTLFSFLYLTCT